MKRVCAGLKLKWSFILIFLFLFTGCGSLETEENVNSRFFNDDLKAGNSTFDIESILEEGHSVALSQSPISGDKISHGLVGFSSIISGNPSVDFVSTGGEYAFDFTHSNPYSYASVNENLCHPLWTIQSESECENLDYILNRGMLISFGVNNRQLEDLDGETLPVCSAQFYSSDEANGLCVGINVWRVNNCSIVADPGGNPVLDREFCFSSAGGASGSSGSVSFNFDPLIGEVTGDFNLNCEYISSFNDPTPAVRKVVGRYRAKWMEEEPFCEE